MQLVRCKSPYARTPEHPHTCRHVSYVHGIVLPEPSTARHVHVVCHAETSTGACVCVTLLLQHRDWMQDEDFPNSLGNDRTVWATEFSNVMMQFLSHMERYMLCSGEGLQHTTACALQSVPAAGCSGST